MVFLVDDIVFLTIGFAEYTTYKKNNNPTARYFSLVIQETQLTYFLIPDARTSLPIGMPHAVRAITSLLNSVRSTTS
jgi:hypothetical protein